MNFPLSLWRRLLLGGASLFAIANLSLATAREAGRPAIHGAFSATAGYSDRYDFLGQTRRNLDLNIVEAVLNASHRFENGIRASAQLYSYELGDYRDLALDFASVDYSFRPEFGVRAGRLKRPLGLHGDSQDIDMVRPFALLPLDLYPKTLRPLAAGLDGAAIYGVLPLGAAGSINYQVGYGWLPKIDVDSPYLQEVTESTLNATEWIRTNTSGTLQVAWNLPLSGLRLLFSANTVPDISLGGRMRPATQLALARNNNRLVSAMLPRGAWDFAVAGRPGHLAGSTDRYTWSAEYTRGDWQFSAEYHVTDDDFTYHYPAPIGSRHGRTKSDSYYVMATWQAAPRLHLGAYYGEGFDDKTDRDGARNVAVPRHTGYLKDVALAASVSVTNWLLVKAQVHQLNGTRGLTAAANGDAARWKADWSYFVLKTTVSF